MKPFLLIQTRPEDETSDDEYNAFLRYGDLEEDQLVRIRAEQNELPAIDLDGYSGVMVGGSPFNFTTKHKSQVQVRIESELHRLLDDIYDRDFPFLGACYGVGLLTTYLGGRVSSKYGEPVGATAISLVGEDKLLDGIDRQFDAFLGHKEAAEAIPDGATLLASSATCPIQMFRVKQNIYATQFHPELDSDGLTTRIRIYRNHGYFQPEEADDLIAHGKQAIVTEPMKLLRNFVNTYAS